MIGHGKISTLLPVCAAAVVAFGSMFSAAPALADGGDQGDAVLSQINATREDNGCGPVAPNAQLAAAAARQANDMLVNGVVSHIGSDGSSVGQRVSDAGYAPYATVGEIIYWSTGLGNAPAVAVSNWMSSPGHRAIITDCNLADAGFSSVSDGAKTIVAGDFGKK